MRSLSCCCSLNVVIAINYYIQLQFRHLNPVHLYDFIARSGLGKAQEQCSKILYQQLLIKINQEEVCWNILSTWQHSLHFLPQTRKKNKQRNLPSRQNANFKKLKESGRSPERRVQQVTSNQYGRPQHTSNQSSTFKWVRVCICVSFRSINIQTCSLIKSRPRIILSLTYC